MKKTKTHHPSPPNFSAMCVPFFTKTETPSLKKIPGSNKLVQFAHDANPLGRITMPEDVANVIYLLCSKEASWINGALIHVDGGEHCL